MSLYLNCRVEGKALQGRLNMERLVGTIIEYGNSKYKVTSCKPMIEYPNMAKACEDSGKYPAFFGAGKILKNGEISKNQTMCLLFFKSGNFVKL